MDRVTAIYNRYGAQVEKALQEDENPFSKVPTWDDVVALDPSPRKKRLDWVCQMISRRRLREEDFYKIPAALADFERLQPVLRREGLPRDINAYRSPQKLFATIDPLLGQVSQRELSRAERARIDAETIMLADTPALKVVEPKTMAAAQYWGRGTRWCTSATESDNAFDDYTKNGEHIVIYRFADGSAIQTCSNGEMADEHDDPITSWACIDRDKRDLMLSTPALREAAVQQNGLAIQDIPADQQTERLRELAVQQNGLTLQDIPADQQTERLRELAVQQNGLALQCIPADQQTERLRELAVRQDGLALQCIPADQQTERLRELAVRQNGLALWSIPADQQTERVRELAVRQNGLAIRSTPPDQQTERVRELAVRQNGRAIRSTPPDQQTERVRGLAVQQDGLALWHIPDDQQTERLRELAVQQDGLAIQCIPDDRQTERVRELAVQQDGLALWYIPADQQTERLRELAVRQNGLALHCIQFVQRTERVKAIAAGESVNPPAGSPPQATHKLENTTPDHQDSPHAHRRMRSAPGM